MKTEIIDLLKTRQPLSCHAISQHLEQSPFTVRPVLMDMASSGQLVMIQGYSAGLYRLPSDLPKGAA